MNQQNNIRRAHTLKPEIERDYHRGFDDSINFLKCIEHGAPHPLIRWHKHEEYELHLITATSGKMFICDYIGEFRPGNLVLIGPFVPHNWVSSELPEEGIPLRDISLQFLDEPLRKACELLPEMRQVLPLLDRAKSGIEFFGISDFAQQQLIKIKNKKGINSFNDFLKLMSVLSTHIDYKLLSNIQLKRQSSKHVDELSEIIDFVTENYNTQFRMTDMAEKIGMDGSQFSRCFKKATGVTFTKFYNHLRINRACQLLAETDKYISTIGYNVGYNNVANFNRRFIELKNTTPSEYRKQSQSKFS